MTSLISKLDTEGGGDSDVLLAIMLTIFIYSLSGFNFFDIYANRLAVEFVSLAFVIVFGFNYFLLGIKKTLMSAQGLMILCLSLSMLLHEYYYSYVLDGIASLFIVALINGTNPALVDKVCRYLIGVTIALSMMGLFLLVIALVNVQQDYSYVYDSNSTNPLRFLGRIQDGYEFGNFAIPRSMSFNIEPSYLPAYFGIPLIFLLLSKKYFYATLIVFGFLLLSTAGSVYSVVALSFLSYFIMKHISKRYFGMFLVCSVLLYFIFLIVFITPLEPLGTDSDLLFGEMMESTREYTEDIYARHRYISAVSRLGTISWSLQAALQHPFGMADSLSAVNGLLIYTFVTAGIIGFIFSLYFYRYVLGNVYLLFIQANSNLYRQIVLAIVAGLCVQAFMFNDYGYSGAHGMILMSLLMRKIRV